MAGLTTTIPLGGKDRHLRYDLNALAEIEERLDTPIAQLADIVVSVRTIRTLVWAGLIHEDGGLTEKDVGAWIGADGLSVTRAMEKVGEALADAFGGDVTNAGRPPTEPALTPETLTPEPGTGTNSGESH